MGVSSGPGARESELRKEVLQLIEHLREGIEIGSLPWLEGEVAQMLSARSDPPIHPTLVGDVEPVSVRTWRIEDTLWAQELLDLPDFYVGDRLQMLEVAAAALFWRAKGRVPDTPDIVSDLVSKRCFRAALSAIGDAELPDCIRDKLAGLVEEQAGPATDAVRARLLVFREHFGDRALGCSSILPEVKATLVALDPDEAADQCDLLELELSEISRQLESEADEAATQARRASVVRLLLLAGIGGVDERSPIEELEARWSDELRRRQSERLHLTTAEGAFRAVEPNLPPLSEDVSRFKQRNLEADYWLPPSLAADLSAILEEPAAKLNSWRGLSGRRARH